MMAMSDLEDELANFADELTASADEVAVSMAGAASEASPRADHEAGRGLRNLDAILRIPVTMKIILGQLSLPVLTLSKLRKGQVLSLDRKVSDLVDIAVNGRVVARGRVVVVDEATGQLGVTLVELADERGVDVKRTQDR